jgi:simple sugar transport system permease protein
MSASDVQRTAPLPAAGEPPLPGGDGWRAKTMAAVTAPNLWGRVAAVLLALVVATPIIIASGSTPGEAYSAIWNGSFGSTRALGDVLNRVDTFLLLGLGITICIRAGFFNVGAEGQLWLGALGATVVALYVPVSGPLLLVLALVAGFVAGALWSGIVALLKIAFGVDELISSLMLNYVAILLIGALTFGPIKAYRAGQTDRTPADADLPILIGGTRLHVGFVLALVAMVLLWLLLTRTRLGYEIRTVGGNPQAARFAGIDVNKVIAKVSLLGGGLCGLAGANAILGVQHVLLSNFSPGWGYTAIAVALLGGLGPFGVLGAALLFGVLEIGATNMQYAAQVPSTLGGLIEGLILVFFLISIPLARVWSPLRRVLGGRRGASANGGAEGS